MHPNQGNCDVIRVPGIDWGHFLQFLPPQLISLSFDHVALLLDDVFLPKFGPSSVNIPVLLQQMQKHNLKSISPALLGDHHGWMDRKW